MLQSPSQNDRVHGWQQPWLPEAAFLRFALLMLRDNQLHWSAGQAPRLGCHIVVVGSMAGKVPAPGQAVYSACKTALVGYFSSLQAELADRCAAQDSAQNLSI